MLPDLYNKGFGAPTPTDIIDSITIDVVPRAVIHNLMIAKSGKFSRDFLKLYDLIVMKVAIRSFFCAMFPKST